MFEIHLEWEDAPGVRDAVLAKTWARIELRLDGRPLTRYWSDRARSVRDGVHGSIFPLAEWVACHWWSLLYEDLKHPLDVSARGRPHTIETQQWLRRHNMLFGREGMAYPDLAIFRREETAVLCWFADPATTTTQGRFLDEGVACIERQELEGALESLVTTVLERTGGVTDPAVEALGELWSAITRSRRDDDEAALCRRLAMLGQDPYAADLPEALEDLLDGLSLSEAVVHDLLAASAPSSLAEDAEGAQRLLTTLPPLEAHEPEARPFSPVPHRGELLPYRAGYARASEVRRHLRLREDEPLRDLEGAIAGLVGDPKQAWPSHDRSGVEAAVQRNGVAAISATMRSKTAQRFLLGRALHHWLFVTDATAPQRLLTRGHDWSQAASRAFAAELLAPARALERRLAGRADWERQGELAEELGVNPMVIAHQLQNHGLG